MHIGDPMTLAQLAQSAMQLYRRLRLAKTVELLRQTALPVIEVRLATGFPNNAYFSRAFRQAFGVSPSDAQRKEAGARPWSI
ncbi:MAG: helix-turn-helix domain-containing protein [Pseudodonghicola sp.]|nr:helix-turn-helix domain-containing protein [Pseudodonghicola sp.]